MKVLFLDIDGVLNTSNTYKEIRNEWQITGKRRIDIDEFRLEHLKRIVDETGAKIVLSSTWRTFFCRENEQLKTNFDKGYELENMFEKHGLKIYDITPYDANRYRENEIRKWLEEHPLVTDFVIIDNESYDLPSFVDKELVKVKNDATDFSIYDNGLLAKHAQKVIEILNHDKGKVMKKTTDM